MIVKNIFAKIKGNKFALAAVIVAAGYVVGVITLVAGLIVLAAICVEAIIASVAKKKGKESKLLAVVKKPWIRIPEVLILAEVFCRFYWQEIFWWVACVGYIVFLVVKRAKNKKTKQNPAA